MEKKRTSVLSPSLLQSITQAFSQSIPTTSSPSEQLANLSVHTPTIIIPDVPVIESVKFFCRIHSK